MRLFKLAKSVAPELALIHGQAMGLLHFAMWMYLSLAGTHLLLLRPVQVAWVMAAFALLSAGLIFWTCRRYAKASAEHTARLHRIGAIILSSNALLHLYLDQKIMNSSMVMLVLMGFGAFILQRRLFLTAISFCISIWLALVLRAVGWSDEVIHYSFGIVFSAVIGWFLMGHRRSLLHKLLQQQRQLRQMADVDWLTGCLRRHALDREIKCLFSAHSAEDCYVLFCDLDYFKRLNDSLGHDDGDKALGQVGELLNTFALQPHCLVGRIGGEEFVMAGLASCKAAQDLAESLRQRVESLAIPNPQTEAKGVLTVSIGMICAQADPTSYSDLCRRADQALYRAKQAGRNRIAQVSLSD